MPPGLPAASQPPSEAPADKRGRAWQRAARPRPLLSRPEGRPGGRPGRGLREGGGGRVGAEGGPGELACAALSCLGVRGVWRCLWVRALPPWRVFCGQEELLCLGGGAGGSPRERTVFVASCCISRKPRECSCGGLPCKAGSLGGERVLKQHGERPRSLDELENGKSRNNVSTNWPWPGGIWR